MGGSGLVQLMTCDLSSKLPLVEKQTPDASQPNRKQRKRQPVPVGSVGRKESYSCRGEGHHLPVQRGDIPLYLSWPEVDAALSLAETEGRSIGSPLNTYDNEEPTRPTTRSAAPRRCRARHPSEGRRGKARRRPNLRRASASCIADERQLETPRNISQNPSDPERITRE